MRSLRSGSSALREQARAPAAQRKAVLVSASLPKQQRPVSVRSAGNNGLGAGAPRTAHAVLAARPARSRAVKVQAFFNNIFSKPNQAEMTRKKYQARVDEINALEPKMQALTDEQLRQKTEDFKRRAQNGESLDAILVEAFAVGAGAEPQAHA